MMDKLKEFAKAMADVAKMISAVAIVFGAVLGSLHLYSYLSTRASATEVIAIKARQDVADVKADNETEWRRAIWDQLGAIARRVGAREVPPPVIAPAPVIESKPNGSPR